MIISQWTVADTAFVKKFDAEKVAELNVERKLEAEGELFTARFNTVCGCNLPWLTDDEQAELDAERELNDNLSGDPIARGLTCEEEDAEVGRIWGIDASRLSDGE